jgi:hypothetical protein
MVDSRRTDVSSIRAFDGVVHLLDGTAYQRAVLFQPELPPLNGWLIVSTARIRTRAGAAMPPKGYIKEVFFVSWDYE